MLVECLQVLARKTFIDKGLHRSEAFAWISVSSTAAFGLHNIPAVLKSFAQDEGDSYGGAIVPASHVLRIINEKYWVFLNAQLLRISQVFQELSRQLDSVLVGIVDENSLLLVCKRFFELGCLARVAIYNCRRILVNDQLWNGFDVDKLRLICMGFIFTVSQFE